MQDKYAVQVCSTSMQYKYVQYKYVQYKYVQYKYLYQVRVLVPDTVPGTGLQVRLWRQLAPQCSCHPGSLCYTTGTTAFVPATFLLHLEDQVVESSVRHGIYISRKWNR